MFLFVLIVVCSWFMSLFVVCLCCLWFDVSRVLFVVCGVLYFSALLSDVPCSLFIVCFVFVCCLLYRV